MKLSEYIALLINLLDRNGDIEIFEALREYGYDPISKATFGELIRFEQIKYKDRNPEQILVIGRH